VGIKSTTCCADGRDNVALGRDLFEEVWGEAGA